VSFGGTRGATGRASRTAAATSAPDPASDATAEPATGAIATAAGTTVATPGQPILAGSHEASPVAAWLAASVGRAIGSFSRDPSAIGPPATASSATAAGAGESPNSASGGFDFSETAMSPLEQAVHDLIGRFSDRGPHGHDPKTGATDEPAADLAPLHALAAFSAPQPPAAAHAHGTPAGEPVRSAQPVQIPEPPANPSHVHLVVDDGPERVVVTVAVRGSEVHVALRGSDDATTAALARNAGSLDHAMRARGLELGELTTERELPQQRQPSPHQEPEPSERRKPDAEPFTLEDKP